MINKFYTYFLIYMANKTHKQQYLKKNDYHEYL